MERQLTNNLQLKAQSSIDCQPSTSCPNKYNSRSNNFYKDSNKNYNKNNASERYQNKTRNRQQKSNARNFNDVVESGRSYLNKNTNAFCGNHNYNKKIGNIKCSPKERFVQANCQFVISENYDYLQHMEDPDLPINWEKIEEVIFSSSTDDLCCPICLHYPTAAKITRCGHIYCWPCILHYLFLGEKATIPCAICFENVKKIDLKSVSITQKIDYSKGDYLSFTLMKIRKGSTIPIPVGYDVLHENSYCKRNSDPTLDLFCKLFFATSTHVSEIFKREDSELQTLLEEYQTDNMPEVFFVQNAMEELTLRQSQFDQQEALYKELNMKSFNDQLNANRFNEPSVNSEYTFFYQSDDGQHIFLHSLNIRMLKHQYKDLRNCPLNIKAKIVDFKGQTVTPDARKRYAHLRHLPISCDYKIAEVVFDNSIVSKQTLQEFAAEINDRKKVRKRKEKAQTIRDRNIEIENKRKIYGIHTFTEFKFDESSFPHFQNEWLESVNESPIINNESYYPPLENEASPPSVEFQSSFAKMVSQGDQHFKSTVQKKPANTNSDNNDDDFQVMFQNITLSDFLDECIKTNKGKKHKKNKH